VLAGIRQRPRSLVACVTLVTQATLGGRQQVELLRAPRGADAAVNSSFSKMWPTWVPTVLSLMKSRSAICR
jgi:hypothetical protein